MTSVGLIMVHSDGGLLISLLNLNDIHHPLTAHELAIVKTINVAEAKRLLADQGYTTDDEDEVEEWLHRLRVFAAGDEDKWGYFTLEEVQASWKWIGENSISQWGDQIRKWNAQGG